MCIHHAVALPSQSMSGCRGSCHNMKMLLNFMCASLPPPICPLRQVYSSKAINTHCCWPLHKPRAFTTHLFAQDMYPFIPMAWVNCQEDSLSDEMTHIELPCFPVTSLLMSSEKGSRPTCIFRWYCFEFNAKAVWSASSVWSYWIELPSDASWRYISPLALPLGSALHSYMLAHSSFSTVESQWASAHAT